METLQLNWSQQQYVNYYFLLFSHWEMHRKLFSYNDQEIYLFLYETWQEFNVLCFASLNDTADTMITKIQIFWMYFLKELSEAIGRSHGQSRGRTLHWENPCCWGDLLWEPYLMLFLWYQWCYFTDEMSNDSAGMICFGTLEFSKRPPASDLVSCTCNEIL